MKSLFACDTVRWCRIAALVVSCAAAGCAPAEPSAEQIQALLVKKPEILYAAIEAHPAEFMNAIDKAARASQGTRQTQAAQAESLRMENEFQNPKIAPIDHRAVLGNPSAPITIVEYTDLQCPFCRQERDVLVELFKHYGDSLRLVVKQMPVTEIHPHAMDGALMFEAMARQNPTLAYKLYDDVYEHQEQFSKDGQAYLERAVKKIGGDLPQALRDQRSEAVRARVQEDMAEGKRFGFTGTPGFLVNGVSLQGAYPLAEFVKLIDRQLATRALAAGGMGVPSGR